MKIPNSSFESEDSTTFNSDIYNLELGLALSKSICIAPGDQILTPKEVCIKVEEQLINLLNIEL